ncbi:docking protein 2 [Osmerus eperlanus]|uniref:docking protein 2 n=1 Tax=Osmerus eperlanus TaxID=29151 RepID=UPI002E15EEDF
MDTHVKAGQIYLQHQKQGKKWKKLWLSLYPSSGSGVARLELQDLSERSAGFAPGGAVGVRRHQEKKVIRLAECVRVLRLPPHAEACPGDNMAAFCVETDERRLVMAAEKEECVDWVEKVCEIAFQKGGLVSSAQQLRMEENLIYVSTEELSEFWVSVQQTDAATLCGLQGAYWLRVAGDELVLKEAETRKCLQTWPYRLLRRYGRDKLTFSIEAGRRCDSGPGTFTFDTRQGDQIFSLIENAISEQKTAAVVSDALLPSDTIGSRRPRSPLPELPVSASIFEGHNLCKSLSSASVGFEECVYSEPADVINFVKNVNPQPAEFNGSDECVYAQPADCIKSQGPAPNSHMPLPLALSHPSPSVSPRGNPTEPVYVDPVHYIPLKPPKMAAPAPPSASPISFSSSQPRDQSEPVYDEVYHRIGLVQTNQDPHQNQALEKDHCREAPIYTEASIGAHLNSALSSMHPQEEPKVDPYAHLYAQIGKVKTNTPPTKSGDQSPEVIYENLGII